MVYLQNVYPERSISTILQKNRGLRTVYRDTASCGSLSWPWCLTSTQFPLPLPTPHPGPCVIELSLVKTCEGGPNTAEKILGEVCGWIFSWKRRKHAKNEETNIWYYHGQYFAGKKVFNRSRSSCSRFTYALFVQRMKVSSIPFLPSRTCFEKTEKC